MQQDSARLFTALWPAPALCARLSDLRDAWRWPPDAKPVADANLHLTLQFLGAFPRRRIVELERALAALAFAPTTLHALGTEVWSAGIAVLRFAPDPALASLHDGIGAVLTDFGVALDPRPFSPHVTLARRARGAEPPRAVGDLEWRASDFVLVESLPGAAGARYCVVRGFGDADARATRAGGAI